MTEDYTNDHILAMLERQAVALEAIAASMPAIIEAAGKRGGYGKRKEGDDHGYYKRVPLLGDKMKPGDGFHVIADTYYHHTDKNRIYFYSPYPDTADPNKYSYISSIAVSGNEKFATMFKGWQPKAGAGSLTEDFGKQADLHLMIGYNKDEKKKYIFIVSAKSTDGTGVTYVDA